MYYFKNGKLVELQRPLEEVVQELKSKLIMYMIQNHNISWIDDKSEEELYNVLFDFLEPVILGKILSENGYASPNEYA